MAHSKVIEKTKREPVPMTYQLVRVKLNNVNTNFHTASVVKSKVGSEVIAMAIPLDEKGGLVSERGIKIPLKEYAVRHTKIKLIILCKIDKLNVKVGEGYEVDSKDLLEKLTVFEGSIIISNNEL